MTRRNAIKRNGNVERCRYLTLERVGLHVVGLYLSRFVIHLDRACLLYAVLVGGRYLPLGLPTVPHFSVQIDAVRSMPPLDWIIA